MNDDTTRTAIRHRLTDARDSLSDVHMTIPASAIFARDRRYRVRRWLAATGAACAAAGLAVGLPLVSGGRPGRAVHVHLAAAWSVTTNPDGTVTFRLRRISRPAQLQHALAEAGVPAMVRWGTICTARGRHALMSTEGFVKTSVMPTAGEFFGIAGGGGNDPELNWSWTITPSKIPHGGHFVISAVPGRVPASDIQAAWEFVHSTATVTCARHRSFRA
jgi:hypothetical protein